MCHKPKAIVVGATKEKPFTTKSTVTSLKGSVYIVTWSQNIKQKSILPLLPTSQHLHRRRIQASVRLQHKENAVGLLQLFISWSWGDKNLHSLVLRICRRKKSTPLEIKLLMSQKFNGIGKESLTKKCYHFPSLQNHKTSLRVTTWTSKILQDLNKTRK